MAEQAHASQLVHHDNQMLFNEVSRLSAQLQAAQHRVQEADARYAMQQQAAQQHAARKAADGRVLHFEGENSAERNGPVAAGPPGVAGPPGAARRGIC